MLANIFSPTQLTIVLIILFLLFGAKKLPELARGLGKSLGEFKKAKKEFEDEISGVTKDEPKPVEAPKKIEASEEEKKPDSSDSGNVACGWVPVRYVRAGRLSGQFGGLRSWNRRFFVDCPERRLGRFSVRFMP